ncbi:hypothetical protein NUM3379_09860 [Kineococcus sp. NUM-3379]
MLAPSLTTLTATTASAASASSAVFSGGTGTVSAGGTLYAKQGAALTLTVVTSSDTKCVAVTGAATLPRQTSNTAKSSWTFTTTAPAGNGVQAFTVAASADFNKNGECTGRTGSLQASYTLDNTGPVVSAALTSAPNGAGWNNSDVSVAWTATDAGSGISASQPFKTGSVTSNGIVTLSAPAQSDRLGNTGAAGSVTVRVDKASPTISSTQVKNADGTTTVTFTCDDSSSGGHESSGIAACVVEGTNSNTITFSGGRTVYGVATDRAGNTTRSAPVEVKSDSTPPVLAGVPQDVPASGWYKDDVTVRWSASDPESGVPTAPADTKITGEGSGLVSTQTVRNGAGLETTAQSSPAVSIDRTAPSTGIDGAPNAWVNGQVNITLKPADNLSGVASTTYSVNGGAQRTGTTLSLSAEGEHKVTYSSTDKAGNVEAAQTATVRIDTSAPTIEHRFTAPTGHTAGTWTNQDVTVTFDGADTGGSGLASVTGPVTTTTEGEHDVVGTATDNAGNSATSTARVHIDKSAPVVTATADRAPNSAKWYDDDVTVSFSATDALSGVKSTDPAKVLGEGDSQSATGGAIDTAGNAGSASVTGIKVDKTAPALEGSFAAGWSKGDVTVRWTASDVLSGLAAGVPAPSVVAGEGANLTATASVTDKAGNATTKTVSGIQIDRTAPTTTSNVPAAPERGWYGSPVEVTLTGSDNLSGATTYYTVDGGAQQTYTKPLSVSGDGTHTIRFHSVDGAGNVEQAGAPLVVQIDGTAPVTKLIDPISPDSGWFVTSGIPVAFDASDATSGLAATYYSIDGGAALTYGKAFTEDLSTGKHTLTYWSVDAAGNAEAKRTIDLNVDTIAPTITGKQSPAANSAGWNNTDVDVTFSCTDEDSGVGGVAGCAGDTKLTNEGGGQEVAGDAVDVAGNKSSKVYGPVSIDKTKPTLWGAATTNPNAADWYRGDVTVKWNGFDGLSGIDAATQPANSVITGEGDNLSAGPVTVKDEAGNVSDAASVSGIKIDRTAPTISGATVDDGGTARAANADKWFNSAVRVRFTATDGLSGIQDRPSDVVLDGNGANQSATGRTTDTADNVASTTVTGINIDAAAPVSEADLRCEGKNGYCRGAKATVVLTAEDQSGLSGVRELRYSTDAGKTWTTAPGATATVDITLNGSGKAGLQYRAVDKAGNIETLNAVEIKHDTIAPTLTHKLSPAANAAGWNKADTTVTFTAEDDSDGSGVDTATVTKPLTVSAETAGQLVNGEAFDLAGNRGTDSATVKLDKTAPAITGAATGTKGANGWYTGPVTVDFTCTDTLSKVASCTAQQKVTSDGAGQSVTGKAVDAADNEASAPVGGINIDSVEPTITVNGLKAIYTLGETASLACTATDATSGVDANGCKITVTGGTAAGVGGFTWIATAKDEAGNTTTRSGTYKVVYGWTGFLQPINDTAHQVGVSTSIFKGGSTVPAKFQLRDAKGTVVQAAAAPQWLIPARSTGTMAAVDEPVYSDAPTTGSTYRYDATAGQYVYNWSTKGSATGFYHRIGVRLDDGQTYYVNIGLR